jgi:glycolate oxidase
MERQELARLLRRKLPRDAVLHETEDLKPYEADGLAVLRAMPLVVALPETIGQIRHVLDICRANSVPVVARGAGTGLSGGALPLENGVLLGLAKFNRILELDPERRIARVEPGVRNLAISEAAAPHGLYYAPDPSSQTACTIAGNVAENAGGVHCLKYGLTVHNILELKVLTMAGDLLVVGGLAPDAPGYDLLALLTGSEGMLGIVVEVTVKLLPRPPAAKLLLAAFGDIGQAGDAVAGIIGAGIVPAGLEMMDALAIKAAEEFAGCGYPDGAQALLLCELDGLAEEVDAQMERVLAVVRQCKATEARIAKGEAERLRFWAGRKAAFPATGRLAPDYYCMDGTIPRKRLADVLRQIGELSRVYELPVANVFHAGDGNLHPLILFDANKPGEWERTQEFGQRISEVCVRAGGTITGEHGVGVEKIDHMCMQFPDAELAQFHAVKEAFDPERLLNPGKAVPTLQRCAEFGAMRVHHGEEKFPDLERF